MQESSHVRVKRKGQVTIPSDIRERLGIEEGAILEIQAHDGDIVLRRTPPLKGGRVVGDRTYNEILDELDELRRT